MQAITTITREYLMEEQLRKRLLIKKRKLAIEAVSNWIDEILKQPPADKEFIKQLMRRK
jgi:hypothetical protein